MKTALKEFLEDLKTGNCKGEEYYLELEKQQIVEAHRYGFYDYGGSEDYFKKKTFNQKKAAIRIDSGANFHKQEGLIQIIEDCETTIKNYSYL